MRKVTLEIAGLEIQITYKKMKRMIMRYQKDQYCLSVPIGLGLQEIESWVVQNKTAIEALASRAIHHAHYEDGGYVDFFGTRYAIKVRDMGRRLCVIHGKTLVVYHHDVTMTVEAYLRLALRYYLVEEIEDFMQAGFPQAPSGLWISKMTSRFGSCKLPEGRLHFSFYLCHFEKEDIRAVVIHELCHLLEPSHNAHFYALVEQYMPTYRQVEKHLKQGGLTA